MIKIILLIIAATLIVGCAGNQKIPRVYWGNYSETLYEVKKEPSVATKLSHKSELENIISKSLNWKILPPPGAYAELGKIYLEEGDRDRAMANFNLEATSYPESKTLVALLLKNIEDAK